MAFFKFRPGATAGTEESASGAETPSVDLLRRKARQRLIGATVLVVLAVAGFPMVFDTQPRPVPVDLTIDIPSKAKVSPEVPPEALKAGSGAGDVPAASAAATPNADDAKLGLTDKEELVKTPSVEKPVPASSISKPVAATTAATKPADAKPADAKSADSKPADAKAPEPKTADAKPGEEKPREQTPSEPRFVVQAGAYTEDARVREVRAKLEKAGLKTYTQVIESKDGKRTRVRVGPFPSKAEAEKVAEKVKSLQVQASILSY